MPRRTDTDQPRAALHRILMALDAFFLPETLRDRSANELASARIGVIGCLADALSTLAFIPWQFHHWPLPVLVAMAAPGLVGLALPFVLRGRESIRHLGHFVCGHMMAYASIVVVFSGGRATGILPVLPMVPMLALLMRGGRASLGWGFATLVLTGVGAVLTGSGTPAIVSGFRELHHFERYPITAICVVVMLCVTLLFDRLWHRSALELADRALADLARAQTNYRNLVEQSLQGIAVIREFRVVYANRALADLFATTLDRIVGVHVNELLDRVVEADRERVVEALNVPAPSPPEPLELRIVREGDGAIRWVQIRWADANSDGLTARQIAYVDITAQRELEATRTLERERLEARIAERTRELEASQQTLRAQERLAAVGTLAAGVAHQINNPVGGILAAAEFAIIAEQDPDRSEVASRALQEIRVQAIRCGRIIRSILQFSRASSTDKWIGDPIIVLRSAIEATRRIARDRQASVSLELAPALGRTSAWMSPIELEQVFVNLILNAIQAQPDGARVWISADTNGSEIEIGIEDDGPGIPAADRSRIFDPFFTTRLKGGGTGLGLSVAHGIVEDHGGRMVLAATGRRTQGGARFVVTLPLSKPEDDVPIPRQASRPDGLRSTSDA